MVLMSVHVIKKKQYDDDLSNFKYDFIYNFWNAFRLLFCLNRMHVKNYIWYGPYVAS